jgi:hypothetical protein
VSGCFVCFRLESSKKFVGVLVLVLVCVEQLQPEGLNSSAGNTREGRCSLSIGSNAIVIDKHVRCPCRHQMRSCSDFGIKRLLSRPFRESLCMRVNTLPDGHFRLCEQGDGTLTVVRWRKGQPPLDRCEAARGKEFVKGVLEERDR